MVAMHGGHNRRKIDIIYTESLIRRGNITTRFHFDEKLLKQVGITEKTGERDCDMQLKSTTDYLVH